MDTSPAGTLITIEGIDGSGKTTQFKLLAERLAQAGYSVTTFDFPQYDKPSSHFVREYLAGAYGTSDQVGPYTSSLFFALDRFQATFDIKQALATSDVVLINRYTGSNMAHQGTKFETAAERRGYFIWLDNLEFNMLKVPRPNLNIVLTLPATVAQANTASREILEANRTRDILEKDDTHQQLAQTVYSEICDLFPRDFAPIDCAKDGEQLSIATIAKQVWNIVSASLPPAQTDAGKGVVKQKVLHNPYLSKGPDGGFIVTEQGTKFLDKAITNTTGDVYAFTENLSPITIAAAMARLSRRGDDMRITLLDEFAEGGSKDDALLKRVITGYGDDSVQQLAGLHFVVENASNLLTKKLEWGRLAAYLEQSTRYIYFDQKNAKGHYKYHIPTSLSKKHRAEYRQQMDRLFDTYSKLVHGLTDYVRSKSSAPQSERDGAWMGATRAQACDAARPVLPVATTATVGIYASGQALESMILHLMSDPLPEARKTGQDILTEARKVLPTFLERADKPERGGALQAYRASTSNAVRQIADEQLPGTLSPETKAVTLTDFWPKNELDLVSDILYEHSDMSLTAIREQVNSWDYEQKVSCLDAFIGERLNRRMRPGRALEKAHYSWDIVCDYGIFRDLQRHRMVDDLAWQALTPRYGYEVPELVINAGLTDLYEQCFDISLALYSYLQSHDYRLEAQYATLLGHRMRWKVTYNARQAFHFHELRTAPQGHPGYRKLVKELHEELAAVHPLIAGHMRFVNHDEDPELTRLAAERYTQYKLSLLDKQ